ncbi:pyrroline-5-carboxylate reductase family protein [Williamsoniiplasma lucivorax]|uniref:Pyrroline-5-carboxylate reductase n=1 Tax=Williamsoniiplasma lucivorax TaxID=209274 RepID=A0A2S5RA17_9MOLU|nr:pyrroline-5-carboxylate reductase [Williamsoniiplasma lucivorax]PPE04143.1 pyrroline-5-carboxylate reductase [Williamsoniiplasma lucivorax]
MKIGFIGLGHMGGSMIKGISNCEQIIGYHYDADKSKVLSAKLAIEVITDLNNFVDQVDLIVLSVRTNIVETMIAQIKKLVPHKIILSVVSGLTIEKMLEMFDNSQQKIVRIMPNLNAEIQMSATGVCYTDNFSKIEKDTINNFIKNFGKVYEIPEEQFEIFTILGGVSPAWFFKIINVMEEIGVQHGMDKTLAKQVAVQSGIGSLQNLSQNSASSIELVNQVAVPGGITIESLKVLNEHHFDEIIKKAANKALEKEHQTFSKKRGN